jgi:hypothetical protein
MISQSEVFELFRRWRDEKTQLRIMAEFLGTSKLSIDTVIVRAEEPLIGVDLGEHGYIEFLFDENWHYDFGSLETMTDSPTDRVGSSSDRSRSYQFGEMISAVRANKTYILFMEIVRTVN